MAPSFSLSLHAVGLIVAYSTYGVLQEKIMRGHYGPDAARFSSSSLLILFNRIFSISTALLILFFKSSGADAVKKRLRPASPLLAYGAVALFNFLSTTAQYEALKYVSYLAKCAKMVPVLVIGAVIYKKKHRSNEWIAGGVILLGCGTYLFSQPPRVSSHHPTPANSATSPTALSALLGALCLAAYLFFDGLVSTTQERVFGKNPSSADPFGADSPVLDQMIWTNVWASGIAIASCLLTTAAGTLGPDLKLLLTTPALLMDVCTFSAVSAVGLIILLNTIASFDALTASLIMTTRQFLSIILNAGIFGNFRSVGLVGWMGVAWVASGIYVKMMMGPPRAPKGDYSMLPKPGSPSEPASPLRLAPYILPLSGPVMLSIVLHFLLAAPFPVNNTDGLQGGVYDLQLHAAVRPTCEHVLDAKRYETDVRTVFASFPRSGNSYLRSLIERGTGWQTSSGYCDKALLSTFKGECDFEANFFVKTHFPTLPIVLDPGYEETYKHYTQAVHLVRNPFDAVTSWWNLEYTPLVQGHVDHEGKVQVRQFTMGDRPRLLEYAKRWRNHAAYWQQAPLRTHTIRYEDLRQDPLPVMMGLVPFLLPPADRPSLERLVCLAEKQSNVNEPYKSRKVEAFASWPLWPESIRMEVLYITRRPFCSFGYDRVLREQVGDLPELRGFCNKVGFDNTRDGFRVVDAPSLPYRPNGPVRA